jgi:hypothetical protein
VKLASWSLFAACAAAVAGCSSVPNAGQHQTPLANWLRAPLPPGDLVVERTYELTDRDVLEVIALALPPGTIDLGRVTLSGSNLSSQVHVPLGDTAHQRVTGLLAGVEGAGRGDLEVRVYDVPLARVSGLGLLAAAEGQQSVSPFLQVSLDAETAGGLRADAEAERGGVELVFRDLLPRIEAGTWVGTGQALTRHYLGGVVREERGGDEVLVPSAAMFHTGVRARAAAVPLQDPDTLQLATLIVFEVTDRVEVEPLQIALGGGSRGPIPLQLPGCVQRSARDAVLLREGEALALVGGAATPGRARVVTIEARIGLESYLTAERLNGTTPRDN